MRRTITVVVLALVWLCAAGPATAATWQQLGTMACADVYASDDSWVFCTHTITGDIYKYQPSIDSWGSVPIGGPGAKFTTAPSRLYGLSPVNSSPDLRGVWSWQFIPNGQGEFGGAMGWVRIRGVSGDIFSGRATLLATDLTTIPGQTGDVYAYSGTPMSWSRIGGPGAMFAVNDARVYGLTPDRRHIYRHLGGTSWQQIASFPNQIHAIYAGGDELYAAEYGSTRGVTGNIMRYNGTPHSWSTVGGPGAAFAVDGEGRLYALTTSSMEVKLYTGSGTAWTSLGTFPNPLLGLYAAGNQTVYVRDHLSHVRKFIPDNDLAPADWCYTFTSSDITFYPIVENSKPYTVWRSSQPGSDLFTVGYREGSVTTQYSTWVPFAVYELDPAAETIVQGEVTMPFDFGFEYYIGYLQIQHPDDSSSANNFKDLGYSHPGLPGTAFLTGGSAASKRCP